MTKKDVMQTEEIQKEFLDFYYSKVQQPEESVRLLFELVLDTEVQGGRMKELRKLLQQAQEYYKPLMQKEPSYEYEDPIY